MRALHLTQAGNHRSEAHISLFKNLCNRISNLGETIWLIITFLLFIVMGPFSVIAVIYGLWSLASVENRKKMAAPASC